VLIFVLTSELLRVYIMTVLTLLRGSRVSEGTRGEAPCARQENMSLHKRSTVIGLERFFAGQTFTHRKLVMSLSVALFTASASAGPLVYAVSTNYNNFTSQFGTMDLTTGTFNEIGSVVSDPLFGLMPGPNGNLLSLSISGNLDSVNPATGAVSVIGATGLGDLAGVTAELNGTVYATDLYNNLYRVNTTTGVATLIGSTGMPPCPSLTSPVEVSDETLFTANGKLYASFDGVNLTNMAIVDPSDLYQINPATGLATLVGPTALGLDAVLQLNGTVYGLDFGYAATNTVLSLNLANGNTTFLNDYVSSPVAGGVNSFDVVGVSPTPEPASFTLVGIGMAAVLASRRRKRR
jgi:PEP-CTERM motif